MISRSSFRNLKHKAKKSMMIRIGRTASSHEDPAFKELLTNINLGKNELKNMHQAARFVVVTGRQHNDSLEKFCGSGLKGEDMFNKEDTFLRVLEDRVCLALGNIISKDVEMLSDSIVKYKTSKLKFDSSYFRTLKNIRKNEEPDFVENADEIIQSNPDLLALQESYIESKSNVINQKDVLLSHLNKRVSKSVEELSEASDMQHHQIYCQYVKENLMKTSKLFAKGRKARAQSMIVNKRPTNDTIDGRKNRARSEDEKMEIDQRLLEQVENKEKEIDFDSDRPFGTSEGKDHSLSIELQSETKPSEISVVPREGRVVSL